LLKLYGYLISTLSVMILALIAWHTTETDGLRALVILSALLSVFGMVLRWLSFERDERPAIPQIKPDPASHAKREEPAPSRAHRAPAGSGRLA
jgi:uncharacterized membrane protein